jgi:hypothetical protein
LTSKQTTTNRCALKAGERQPAERAASDEKGKDYADEERTSKEEEDAPLLLRLPPPPPPPPLPLPPLPLLLLPLPPPHAAMPAPPQLPLLKQWQQWRQQ